MVELPSDALYDACRYVLDVPETLQKAIQSAHYLGRGASSAAWRLADGNVFKITSDPIARHFLEWQHQHQHRHLATVHRTGDVRIALAEMAQHEDAWETWGYAVQPYYSPLQSTQWNALATIGSKVGASTCKSRPGWCRTKNGLMAHGVVARTHLETYRDALGAAVSQAMEKPHANCTVRTQALAAVAALSTWWGTAKTQHAGLDIDKADNWGIDLRNGEVVLLDPVYGNDVAGSHCHWNAEYY